MAVQVPRQQSPQCLWLDVDETYVATFPTCAGYMTLIFVVVGGDRRDNCYCCCTVVVVVVVVAGSTGVVAGPKSVVRTEEGTWLLVVVVVYVNNCSVDMDGCYTSYYSYYRYSPVATVALSAVVVAAAAAFEPATPNTAAVVVVEVVVVDHHIQNVDSYGCGYGTGPRTWEETVVAVVAGVVGTPPSVRTMVYPNWNDVCVWRSVTDSYACDSLGVTARRLYPDDLESVREVSRRSMHLEPELLRCRMGRTVRCFSRFLMSSSS